MNLIALNAQTTVFLSRYLISKLLPFGATAHSSPSAFVSNSWCPFSPHVLKCSMMMCQMWIHGYRIYHPCSAIVSLDEHFLLLNHSTYIQEIERTKKKSVDVFAMHGKDAKENLHCRIFFKWKILSCFVVIKLKLT